MGLLTRCLSKLSGMVSRKKDVTTISPPQDSLNEIEALVAKCNEEELPKVLSEESAEPIKTGFTIESKVTLGRAPSNPKMDEAVAKAVVKEVQEQVEKTTAEAMGIDPEFLTGSQTSEPAITHEDLINAIPTHLRYWKRSDHHLYNPRQSSPPPPKEQESQVVHRMPPPRYAFRVMSELRAGAKLNGATCVEGVTEDAQTVETHNAQNNSN